MRWGFSYFSSHSLVRGGLMKVVLLSTFTEDTNKDTGFARDCPHSNSSSKAGSQGTLRFCVNVGRSSTKRLPTTVTSPNPIVLRNQRKGTWWQSTAPRFLCPTPASSSSDISLGHPKVEQALWILLGSPDTHQGLPINGFHSSDV